MILYLKTRPLQLVKRIDKFKVQNKEKYEFEKHPEDEFWIVTDVDDNWSERLFEEWNQAIKECEEKKYDYAVSNPFFEIWLLLHFSDATEDDKKFAVTDEHSYEPTNHFRNRLSEVGAGLKDKKHIKNSSIYTIENIKNAIKRAINLLEDKNEKQPKYFATTVFRLLEEISGLSDSEKLF